MSKERVRISLAAARTNAGKTQDEWAELMGVTKSTIWNWENGRGCPNVPQLRKISELSAIPMDFIFVPEEYE